MVLTMASLSPCRSILFTFHFYAVFFTALASSRVPVISQSSAKSLRLSFQGGSVQKVTAQFPTVAFTRQGCSLPTTAALVALRGGEISLPDQQDEDGGTFETKFRNFIRNVLSFGDNKLPIVSGVLRPLLKAIESLTGLRLLPQKVNKANKKGKPKFKTANEASEDNEVTASKKAKKNQKKAKASLLKQPSETTKKHLTSKMNSGNPNFRIQSELKEFLKSPPPNLSVQVGSNIRVWVVTMIGANNTIYEGEVYKLRISFPAQYPAVPPSVYFLKGHIPKHEHVYTNGDICLSLLGKDWRPTMTAQSISVSILSILSSARSKKLPIDNANHASSKPGEFQKDWVYHDDNC